MDVVLDTYNTIKSPSEGLFKDKGSRFIAYAFPVCDSVEVKGIVDALKKEHHAARHHCYAWRIAGAERVNDDGEPSGTAGRPIMGVIEKSDLDDVLVVVVRYFGGILLGVPGLINAYRSAAADALANAVTQERVRQSRIAVEFDYGLMNDLQKLVKGFPGLSVNEQHFDLQCNMTVSVPRSTVGDFLGKIKKYNDEKGTCIQCRTL